MNISLSAAGELTIGFASISLHAVRPMLNGQRIEHAQSEITANTLERVGDAERIVRLRYTAPEFHEGAFTLDIRWEAAQGRCWMSGSLEQFPEDVPLNSFGWCFADITHYRAFLRSGYHSWDGSKYIGRDTLAAEAAGITGYAMTQLLAEAGHGSVICGFDRHDRFQQTFTFTLNDAKTALAIATHWDQKQRSPEASCKTEQLVLFEHDDVEEALRTWARLVAATSPNPPRALPERITGWCSWYNLYANINEDLILTHLRSTATVRDRETLPLQVFLTDDGFTPEMGDWLEVKPQFPRGMKALLDDVRAAGFTPGLWIAPFVVGNRSRLFQEHPDWVVHDRQTGEPLAQMRFYGEFRWHKRSEEYYILDATHPAAFDYLRHVFRTWRNDWGCEYFKTDFMLFGSEHGPERARWHTPGKTRIDIWRQVASMIREAIGDAIWSGCGCPLWASVGLVDAIRIGRDVGVKWRGDQSAQGLIEALMLRNFAHTILWQADPDCLLLRSRFHDLTEDEVRSLALYAGMSGGALMTSDTLDELAPDRLALFKMLLSTGSDACRYPMLGRPLPDTAETRLDPVIVQVQTAAPGFTVHIFNTGEDVAMRRYTFRDLALPAPATVRDAFTGELWAETENDISVTLQAHESVWLVVEPTPSGSNPKQHM